MVVNPAHPLQKGDGIPEEGSDPVHPPVEMRSDRVRSLYYGLEDIGFR